MTQPREQWFAIPDWPYSVSTLGRVKRDPGPGCPKGRLLKSTSPTRRPMLQWFGLSKPGAPLFKACSWQLLDMARSAGSTPYLADIEDWRTVADHPHLEVSTLGRIRDRKTQEELETFLMRGFVRVSIDRAPVTLHTLVARAFLPPTDTPRYARHLDADKRNNSAANLAWGDPVTPRAPKPHDPQLPYIPLPNGTILDRQTNLPLPTTKGPHGIVQVTIEGVRHPVHRLVAKAHVPNPRNCRQVKHLDGDKLNNAAENLQWVKPSDDPNRIRAALWSLKRRSK